MKLIECPFCHEELTPSVLIAHRVFHTLRGPDGQQQEHLSLRADLRFVGSLDDVPSVYEHIACGAETEMPEDIIRSYLVNPFLYNDTTFCVGCEDYVDTRGCVWTETGETLYGYNQKLKAVFSSIPS